MKDKDWWNGFWYASFLSHGSWIIIILLSKILDVW